MIAKFCKTALALSLLLMVLIGCNQQAIKKVEILTNDQGLPEAEELLRKSSELINSLESYSMSTEVDVQNYGNTKEELIWDGLVSTAAIQYIKSPYFLFSDTNFIENNSTLKNYFTDAYGVLENSGKQWEEISDENQELLNSLKEQWRLQIDPYAVIKDMNDLTMTIGQEKDSYILNVAGNKRKQMSQEGHHNQFGQEYTLVVTTDMKYKISYVIHKDTLLPKQKIEEVEQMIDYSGKKSFSDRTITFTYEDYNNINTKKMLDEVKKISESVKEN